MEAEALARASAERSDLSAEMSRVAEASRKAEDEKLHFLANDVVAKLINFVPNAPSLAEQLVGGGGGKERTNQRGAAFGEEIEIELTNQRAAFGSWSKLASLAGENVAKVGVVIKALRKKIKALEDELTKEEELKLHLAANQVKKGSVCTGVRACMRRRLCYLAANLVFVHGPIGGRYAAWLLLMMLWLFKRRRYAAWLLMSMMLWRFRKRRYAVWLLMLWRFRRRRYAEWPLIMMLLLWRLRRRYAGVQMLMMVF